MYLITSNSSVRASYEKYLKNGENVLIPPFRFDSDALAKMRKSMSDFMKNNALYGFKESYVSYEVDTLSPGKNIQIAVDVSKRVIEKDRSEEHTSELQSRPHLVC